MGPRCGTQGKQNEHRCTFLAFKLAALVNISSPSFKLSLLPFVKDVPRSNCFLVPLKSVSVPTFRGGLLPLVPFVDWEPSDASFPSDGVEPWASVRS
jgi:hypothetical protein